MNLVIIRINVILMKIAKIIYVFYSFFLHSYYISAPKKNFEYET